MKRAQVVGRLGRAVELETTANGTPVASFDLAVNFYNFATKQKDTEWIRIKTFGTQADFIAQYSNPGDVIAAAGDMTFEKWDSKKFTDDEGIGAKMSRLVVLADRDGLELFSKGDTQPRQQTLGEAVEDPKNPITDQYEDIKF